MEKIKIVNGGYTLTVTSWENDADYYNTLSLTVQTIEEAKAWHDVMQLCKVDHSFPSSSLGNAIDDFSIPQFEAIRNCFKTNPVLNTIAGVKTIETMKDDKLQDLFTQLSGELLGFSDFYLCRVMESCVITYSAEDIYLETIKFKD